MQTVAAAIVALLCGHATAPSIVQSSHTWPAPRPESRTYHATGTIRAFGPVRAYLLIAHEEIPGYMGAMTMSFWPERSGQLDGLNVGDRVDFEFTETEDARRVLASIRKRP